MTLPLAFGMPGPLEMMFLLAIGLLIFGKRLPEVGRSIGQTVVQFKKGLNEVQDELHKPTIEAPKQIAETTPVSSPLSGSTSSAVATPLPGTFKFDPHTGEPINR